MISSKIVLRYILFQIPALIILTVVLLFIRKIINFPGWIAFAIITAWIFKDAIMFTKVWRSYDTNKSGHEESMLGMNGIVMDELNPIGYVRIKGELWKAEIAKADAPVKKGEGIKVINVENMKLIVSNIKKDVH